MTRRVKLTRVCHDARYNVIFEELPQCPGSERREEEGLGALRQTVKNLIGNGKDRYRGSTLEATLLLRFVPDVTKVKIVCQARSLERGCLSHSIGE